MATPSTSTSAGPGDAAAVAPPPAPSALPSAGGSAAAAVAAPAMAAPTTPWSDVKLYLPPDSSASVSSRLIASSSTPAAAATSSSSSAPEEELKPTAAELKQAYAGAIAGRHGPDAPLMTKAMREREDIRLGRVKKEYKEIRIRTRFSDRTQLEALFPSSAPLPTLYRFIRSCLSPASSAKPFVLYQTPPKRDFAEKDAKLKGKSLGELLGNTPNATLLIRWDEAGMNSNTFSAPLSLELLSKAVELPTPPVFENATPGAPGAGNKLGGGAAAGEDKGKKAMPKWLKGLQPKK